MMHDMFDMERLAVRIKERQAELEPLLSTAIAEEAILRQEKEKLTALEESLEKGSITIDQFGLITKLIADPVSVTPTKPRIRQNEVGSAAWKQGELTAKADEKARKAKGATSTTEG